MAYKITGTVLLVGAPVSLPSKSGTPFTKRDIVITVRKFDPYTGQPSEDTGNTPKFSFVNDRCQLLDGVMQGDIVTIHFDIQGRGYEKEGRTEYFTEARPFRIDTQRQTYHQQSQNAYHDAHQTSAQPYIPPVVQNEPQTSQNALKPDSDLPF